MKLHEYQAKRLFAKFGLPVGQGSVASSPDEAEAAAKQIGGDLWVVKAQVHAGGRGKAGGVKLAHSIADVRQIASDMLGSSLVTLQTDEQGLPIHQVMVEAGQAIAQELYLSALVDRACGKLIFMASASGGMNIEEVAATTPEKIFTIAVDAAAGIQPWQIRRLGFGLGLEKAQLKEFAAVIQGIYQLFTEQDASLVEINPLVVLDDGALLALDAKLDVDDNALYRHPDLQDWRDASQEDPRELEASQHDLNYVALHGNIGCMVNGAGLAMATMDMINLHGGQPANFLDVGGGATADRVAEAFKLILSDTEIKAILVNIFGGIVRCDLIAEGIIQAVKEVGVTIPVVVRLEGTNVEQGRAALASSGLSVITANDLSDAAQQAVAAAGVTA